MSVSSLIDHLEETKILINKKEDILQEESDSKIAEISSYVREMQQKIAEVGQSIKDQYLKRLKIENAKLFGSRDHLDSTLGKASSAFDEIETYCRTLDSSRPFDLSELIENSKKFERLFEKLQDDCQREIFNGAQEDICSVKVNMPVHANFVEIPYKFSIEGEVCENLVYNDFNNIIEESRQEGNSAIDENDGNDEEEVKDLTGNFPSNSHTIGVAPYDMTPREELFYRSHKDFFGDWNASTNEKKIPDDLEREAPVSLEGEIEPEDELGNLNSYSKQSDRSRPISRSGKLQYLDLSQIGGGTTFRANDLTDYNISFLSPDDAILIRDLTAKGDMDLSETVYRSTDLATAHRRLLSNNQHNLQVFSALDGGVDPTLERNRFMEHSDFSDLGILQETDLSTRQANPNTSGELDFMSTETFLHFFEGNSKTLHIYRVSNNYWMNLDLNIDFDLSYFHKSIALPGGRVFLTGQVDKKDHYAENNFYEFDPKSRTLIAQQSMLKKRSDSSHSIVYSRCDNSIYVISGYVAENKRRLQSCERYRLTTGNWEKVEHLHFERPYNTVCLIEDEDEESNDFKLYVIGGINKFADFLRTVEIYDSRQKLWTLVQPVFAGNEKIWKRCLCQPLSRNEIMFFGGYDDHGNKTDECSIYNITQNKVTMMPEKKLNVSGYFYDNIVSAGNDIFFALSFVNFGQRLIHVFDAKSRTWKMIEHFWKSSSGYNYM